MTIMTLQHSDTIIGCFHQGKDNLPGLPGNVKVIVHSKKYLRKCLIRFYTFLNKISL